MLQIHYISYQIIANTGLFVCLDLWGGGGGGWLFLQGLNYKMSCITDNEAICTYINASILGITDGRAMNHLKHVQIINTHFQLTF